MSSTELLEIATELEAARDGYFGSDTETTLNALSDVADEFGNAWSGSWLGYHADVYYAELSPPPPGAHFSPEWGMKDMLTGIGTQGDWREYDPAQLRTVMLQQAGNPDLDALENERTALCDLFENAQARFTSILHATMPMISDSFLEGLQAQAAELESYTPHGVLQHLKPSGQLMSRDSLAMTQGLRAPSHLRLKAISLAHNHTIGMITKLAKVARQAGSHLERLQAARRADERVGTNVFIGHGRSPVWRDLKDFVQDRLHLPWDEFNRVPVAGVTNQERLVQMLDSAAVAFIVMTAEDETAEGTLHARMNVIHEVGLFQGRLGFTKAIVLLEEGCEEFSNIQGIGQIRFPPGNIAAKFEDIRLVLEREGLVAEG